MFHNLKTTVSALIFKLGLDVRRASALPFGVQWCKDIQFFPEGRRLNTILDVGANLGQTAAMLSAHFPKSRIYSFEPVPSTFEVLVRNTSGLPHVEAICCALGAEPGSLQITTDPLSGSNTMLIQAGHSSTKAVTQVPVKTVDDFCKTKGIDRINLLKIDTEGFETNVLKGAESLLKSRSIDFVLAECDFFRRQEEPHGNFLEIFHHLSSLGFHVVSFYTGGVDDLGWIWGDVLFRQSTGHKPGRVSGSPLRSVKFGKLAVLAS